MNLTCQMCHSQFSFPTGLAVHTSYCNELFATATNVCFAEISTLRENFEGFLPTTKQIVPSDGSPQTCSWIDLLTSNAESAQTNEDLPVDIQMIEQAQSNLFDDFTITPNKNLFCYTNDADYQLIDNFYPSTSFEGIFVFEQNVNTPYLMYHEVNESTKDLRVKGTNFDNQSIFNTLKMVLPLSPTFTFDLFNYEYYLNETLQNCGNLLQDSRFFVSPPSLELCPIRDQNRDKRSTGIIMNGLNQLRSKYVCHQIVTKSGSRDNLKSKVIKNGIRKLCKKKSNFILPHHKTSDAVPMNQTDSYKPNQCNNPIPMKNIDMKEESNKVSIRKSARIASKNTPLQPKRQPTSNRSDFQPLSLISLCSTTTGIKKESLGNDKLRRKERKSNFFDTKPAKMETSKKHKKFRNAVKNSATNIVSSAKQPVRSQKLKTIACDDCDEHFKGMDELLKHAKTHTDGSCKTLCANANHRKTSSGIMGHKQLSNDHSEVDDESPYGDEFSDLSTDVPIFTCPTCGRDFKRAVNLKLHLRIHEKHVCHTCGKVFGKGYKLKMHRLTHTKKHPVCRVCGRTCSSNRHLDSHMQTHGKRFACKLCDKDFPIARTLAKHLAVHSRKNSCHACGRRFGNARKLRAHTRNHSVSARVCDTCGKAFSSVDALRKHVRLHLRDLVKCGKCDRAFSRASNLINHARAHSRIHMCEKCGKEFTKSAHLKKHCFTHLENGATCGQCGLTFSTARGLSCHVVAHIRNHACVKCGKTFHRLYDLERHAASHKRVKCSTCGKIFANKYSCRSHSICHEKDLACKICGWKFYRASHLRRHYKTHSTM